ncbi:MAG: sulfite oxidase-like oxidoreductase [Candidatus Sulfotelmatobacter sp.]|nr:sulfite oxidase-like oxidoreductase [Candidatus Sulfotelmatobacter sp.]
MNSRRLFLKYLSAAAVAAGARPPVLMWALPQEQVVEVPGEDGMILRSYRFVDLESPVEYFNTWLTPVPHFFVRNHMHEPSELDPADWRLSIGGEVEKPFAWSLAELLKLEPHSVVNTLECAGNGRSLHRPQVPGVQWGQGAVGTARFSGPRLRDVLQHAGVKSTGKHVMFRGLDEVPGKVPPFIRSIPIEKAIDADTLIATHMNGSPLTKHHGFPARALVPGWIGAASCKWITEIKVIEKEFVGNFMSPAYRFPNQAVKTGDAVNPEDTHPVTALNVKSVITGPSNGARLKSGRVAVHGVAWAGEADVAKVEISTDGGALWNSAALGPDQAHYAWRLWTYDWKPRKSGDYTVMSRASDSQGRTQPSTAVWNPSGYLYNAVDQVNIHVA